MYAWRGHRLDNAGRECELVMSLECRTMPRNMPMQPLVRSSTLTTWKRGERSIALEILLYSAQVVAAIVAGRRRECRLEQDWAHPLARSTPRG